PEEPVVVAVAGGALVSIVGEVAEMKGCRVVGIAVAPVKCAYVVNVLGFDGCIDRHSPDFSNELAKACAEGIDVYFESVGGPVFDAVLPLLNVGARVPVFGTIASYNDT